MAVNVKDLIAPMAATHKSGENQTLQWRLHQLNSLLLMIKERQEDFIDALHKDLRKERTECMYSEIDLVKNEIKQFQRELKGWMEPTSSQYPCAIVPSVCKVHSVPLSEPGCLILAPFNYPFCLSLLAVVGSFGGGNPCVLKPSELCPSVSALFAKLVPKYFEKGAFQVVEGGAEETTALMEQTHWGLVHFTGSERVGKIIQSLAATTLSPTVLELGGKSPTIISDDCPDDMSVVCNRVMAGKLMNCGQTCIAPDFVLCHRSKVTSFCEEAAASIDRLFGKDQTDSSSELPRIVQQTHAQRHIELIEEIENANPEKIIFGGSKKCDVRNNFIAPTLVLDPSKESRLMKEEIFGPILPIVIYDSDDEAVRVINEMQGTPLALYVFTKSQQRYQKFMSRIPSGSIMRNETILQFIVKDFPFGGLWTSGIGNYKGKASFNTFTHKRSSLYHPCHSVFEYGGLRYHPHGAGAGSRGKILLILLNVLPDVPTVSTTKLISFGAMLLYLSVMGTSSVMTRFADVLEATANILRHFSS